jgi:hypothetical protein
MEPKGLLPYLPDYGLYGPGLESRQGQEVFLFSETSTPAVGPPTLLFSGYPGSFLGAPVCEVNHTRPSGIEVKNEWNCTSTPSVYLHGMDRDTLPLHLPVSGPYIEPNATFHAPPNPHFFDIHFSIIVQCTPVSAR